MQLKTKRVYEPKADGDGMRVLVDRLWPREGPRGVIPELFERSRDLSQQVQGLRPQRDRYRALIRQRLELEQKIASLRKKQTDLQTQLRGHQFLNRVQQLLLTLFKQCLQKCKVEAPPGHRSQQNSLSGSRTQADKALLNSILNAARDWERADWTTIPGAVIARDLPCGD